MTDSERDHAKYKKLSDIEHVLARPTIYLGICKVVDFADSLIFNSEEQKFSRGPLTYNPAFIKMFAEILDNSVDESKRSDTLNTIKVDYDKDKGYISVYDNGGIPVEVHNEYGEWIPEMIFSTLRCGENYNDEEERTVIGTNGVGSSLTNIFSTKFIVETCDGKNKFKQVFKNNLNDRDEAVVTPVDPGSKGYTKITFYPDWERLDTTFDDDTEAALVKRVYDSAGLNTNLSIKLNGKVIKIKSFKDYVKLFTDDFYYEESEDRKFKVGIAPSNGSFESVSFVNGSACSDHDSTHVKYIFNQISDVIRPYLKKKYNIEVKPSIIKNYIKLFIDATIVNPEFDSQTKSKLTTTHAHFGAKFELPKSFMKNILKTDVVQKIIDYVELKKAQDERNKLRKLNKTTDGFNPRRITKLNDAESKNRIDCILFAAEGASAATGITGNSNRLVHGTYPLKGKVINVDKGIEKLLNNEEFKNLIAINGLKIGEEVKSLEDLRYGKFAITVDADADGSHIEMLLVNLFMHFWPELMDLGWFMKFRTPLIKTFKSWTSKFPEHEFFSETEFHEWQAANPNSKLVSKYYKGLGGHKSYEFKSYFKNIDQYLIQITHDDIESTKELLELGFNSKKSDERKEWLALEKEQA